MACISIFSSISSGNLSQPLIVIAGVSSGIWLFWLFSSSFLSRGCLFWIVWLIWFSIQSSPLWSVSSSGKYWCSLILSESQKKVSIVSCYIFFSVPYHSCSSMWPNLFWWYLKQLTGLTTESKFLTFSFFTFSVSQQYLSADVNIWYWSFITAFITTLLLLLGPLYVFTGRSTSSLMTLEEANTASKERARQDPNFL